jgi:hypothetical protein
MMLSVPPFPATDSGKLQPLAVWERDQRTGNARHLIGDRHRHDPERSAFEKSPVGGAPAPTPHGLRLPECVSDTGSGGVASSLSKSRPQVLHRRVAEILRDRFGATAAAEPEALAYHFTQAGLTDEWWGI